MEKHVEERFELIENNLKETGEILKETGEHLKVAAQVFQEASTLARQNQKTLEALLAREKVLN